MSGSEKVTSTALSAPHRVGYKRPPAEHRFQKGRSGNPGGRPKGAKNKVPKGQGLDFGTQPANQMLLHEAYRTVSLREGERLVELPVIQAVFRSIGVSAMKGNRLAQATLAELVRGIEEEDRQLRSRHFETACEYKWEWEQAIEHARMRGLPEPTPLPHPDDVVIDVRKAEVRYQGPITPEEKERWDRLLAFRDEQQEYVSHLAGRYRDDKGAGADTDRLASLAANWERAVELYDRMNEPLPERYRKRLENRFYPGVSVAPRKGTRRDLQARSADCERPHCVQLGRWMAFTIFRNADDDLADQMSGKARRRTFEAEAASVSDMKRPDRQRFRGDFGGEAKENRKNP